MISPEHFSHPLGHTHHHPQAAALTGEAHHHPPLLGNPDHSGHPSDPATSTTPLSDSEGRLEEIIRHDPLHHHMGEVYKELDSLRLKDQKHFGHNLTEINNKLHRDGLLPGLTIIQDHYTGADHKERVGYSVVANDQNNPGHKLGSEVSTSHPTVADTPASRLHYRAMHHGHGARNLSQRYSAENGAASSGGYDSGLQGQEVPVGERKDLIDQALQIAGVAINPSTEAAMNTIITRESGWNASAVNTTDINAQNGDPSKGLMQVIHATFEQYRDKSLPDSQTDPIANMVAALRYMGSRYGGGDNGQGLLNVASRSGGY